MQHITLKAAATQITDQGVFEAVISTEAVDREKDIVSAAAMVDALKKWKRPIPLAWNHSTKAEDIFGAIEPTTIRHENGEVLAQGQVDLDSKVGQEAWRSFKNRTIGFSFGYIVAKHDKRKGGGRHITGLDIFEVTATPTPMNNDTRVVATKSLATEALDALAEAVSEGRLDTDEAAKQLQEAVGINAEEREAYERMSLELLAEGLPETANIDGLLEEDGRLPEPEAKQSIPVRMSENEEARVGLESLGLKLMPVVEDGPLTEDGILPRQRKAEPPQVSRLPGNEEARLALEALGLKLIPTVEDGPLAEDGRLPVPAKPAAKEADRLATNEEARLALLALGWQLTPVAGEGRESDGILPAPGEPQAKEADRLATNEEERVRLLATGVAPGHQPAEHEPLLDEDEIKGLTNGTLKAVWSVAFINDLPDGSFLYIESGGSKDDTGKTQPRSLRHFPYKDSSGEVDLPHLRNALARIPQSNLPQDVKDRLTKKAQSILDSQKSIVVSNDDPAPDKAKADDPAPDKSATADPPLRTHDDDRAVYELVTDGIDMKAPPQVKSEPPPEVPEVSELNRQFYDLMLETLIRKD